jgi:hypothetical protein
MYYRGIGGGNYVSYAEHPARFTYAAIAYLSSFLLFGGGSLAMLIGKLRQRWQRRPLGSWYVAKPLSTRHNDRRSTVKKNKGTP